MFEAADVEHRCSKADWRLEEPVLREQLLALQVALGQQKRRAVLVIVGGVDGAGKSEVVHQLNEWMDPRYIHTHGFGEPSDEERERPPMWRYWRMLPPKGVIGIYYGSWYSAPIVSRVLGDAAEAELDQQLAVISRHEEMLAAEGVLILKFWMHLSKVQQRDRLKALERDPETRWRVSREDWRRFKRYDEFRKVCTRALRGSSSVHAPWLVVPGLCKRYRALAVGRALLDAMQKALVPTPLEAIEPEPVAVVHAERVLAQVIQGRRLAKRDYESQLEHWQGELALLARHPRFRKRSLIAVFEGWDAAGKGSAIRRVTAALDARHYQIVPVAAPTEEARAQPYLWRFWRQLPRRGQFVIFDRSWYGRVLVERVEHYCRPSDWQRAYAEINDFEAQLATGGSILAKFWLQISPEEQLRRFEERQQIAYKRFKITEEDWRNRARRADYEAAVGDMVVRCSTEYAPWSLIDAEDKRWARIRVLQTLVERLQAGLHGS
ncbi:MAG: polyphosphate:AMP phosphotransferase [Xanthomonadales bacterium]|jgi:polyphosphate:AMP phosphotransferase|nr:polyphosphate:AMP phosphotransferase [Xanthomonadales bacterium]